MIRRRQHFFDTPLGGRKVRRTIKNWSSFREPGKPWQESVPGIEVSSGAPDNWSGRFDFLNQASHGPLQSFLGDAINPDNTVMTGCRLADNPNVWINIKALDVLPVGPVPVPGKSALRWSSVWPETTLEYETVAHKLVKTIRLDKPGYPELFGFTIRTAPGMSIEFVSNGARILDATGTERMKLLAPWGLDSSTVHPEHPEGRKPIRVEMREGESRRIHGREYQVVEIVPNKDDLESAVYPVEIDPTVQITGIVDIEDNWLYEYISNRTYNYGGYAYQFLVLNSRTALARIAASSIPAGSITGFRMLMYRQTGLGQVSEAFLCADANDWPEGTGTGQAQTGMSCWNQCKLDSQNWAGHPTLGCMVSGTDYDADASPPQHTIALGWNTFILDPAWPPLWHDAIRVANGIVFLNTPGVAVGWQSSEGVNPLYFEIDYEAAAGCPAAMLKRKIAE